MNIKQLYYFTSVVDFGSSVKAAGQLHVAPTALSMQIARLEEDVGGALLDRSCRPMELTALGRYFYPRAKALLAEANHLHEEAQAVAAGRSGVLSIGYTRSTIFSILPSAIRSFREDHQQIKVELMTMLSEHQCEALRAGRIEIGLSRYHGAVDPVEGLVFTKLLDDPFVAALPSSHRLSKRKKLHASDLDDMFLITYPKVSQSRFAESTVAMLRAAGGHSAVANEANDIHTALGMAASGLGFCLVGRSVSRGNRPDLSFVPVLGMKDKAAVYIVTKAGQTSRVVSEFVETLINTTTMD